MVKNTLKAGHCGFNVDLKITLSVIVKSFGPLSYKRTVQTGILYNFERWDETSAVSCEK